MLFEIVVSALIAPIMMLMQCRAVAEILFGLDAGWSAQRRGDGSLPRDVLIRQYTMPTALGVLLAAGAYAVSGPLLHLDVAGGARADPGDAGGGADVAAGGRPVACVRLGLLLTPEEREPPPVLKRANELAAEYAEDAAADPIAMLTREPILFDTHHAHARRTRAAAEGRGRRRTGGGARQDRRGRRLP